MLKAIPRTRNSSLRLVLIWLVLTSFSTAILALPQTRSKRPGLIRDTDVAEGKEEATVEKGKPYDPLMAQKTVKIGDFYYKKKNYTAAIQRYIEALEYQPDRAEALEALGRAYEKTGEISKAVEAYREFISKNPESPKNEEFRAKLTRLEKKT
jgi:tetratricopeptide (TPR) repeat protein